MPSLHFATSVMAAHLLAETGPIAGAIGWTYAATLGFALVYLGEHYVVDLLAGLGADRGRPSRPRRSSPRRRPRSLAASNGWKLWRTRERRAGRDAGIAARGGRRRSDAARRVHAAQRATRWLLHPLVRRLHVLRAAADHRLGRDLATGSSTATRCGSSSAAVFAAASYFGQCGCSASSSFATTATRLSWHESYEVTIAGVAASRLFSPAGAGGLA